MRVRVSNILRQSFAPQGWQLSSWRQVLQTGAISAVSAYGRQYLASAALQCSPTGWRGRWDPGKLDDIVNPRALIFLSNISTAAWMRLDNDWMKGAGL